jgi:hypothetical protein
MNSFRGRQNPEERDPGESKRATGEVTQHEGKVPVECYPVHADDVRESLKLAFEAVKRPAERLFGPIYALPNSL